MNETSTTEPGAVNCSAFDTISAVPSPSRCECSPLFASTLDSQLDYDSFFYCAGDAAAGRCALMLLWLFFLFVVLGDTADSFLVPALTTVSDLMQLSPQVAGVTVLALANGAPDFFTGIAAFSSDSSGSDALGIGACLGAGMFITTVIFGSVILASPFHQGEGGGFHAEVSDLWTVERQRLHALCVCVCVCVCVRVGVPFLREVPDVHTQPHTLETQGFSIPSRSSLLPRRSWHAHLLLRVRLGFGLGRLLLPSLV